ncbi:uncharacterized protein [Temnothorax nylanderi]|uniref:uncharacterized protein n=1 Tax=Temnothorax nylanderi TaxID=102681 RepID=UPI003A863F79
MSSNTDYNGYSSFIDELTILCSNIQNNHNLLICGDFNAHSSLWDPRHRDYKGDLLEDWAAQMDVRLINVGNKATFASAQGSSIIDLTWASPGLLGRIRNWAVRDEMESLSDHAYITFTISDSPTVNTIPRRAPRWNFRRMDTDIYQASIEWTCAITPNNDEYLIDFKPDKWIHLCISNACKAAVPRVRDRKRSTYWWNSEIARLRKRTIAARRVWSRSRHRDSPEDVAHKRAVFILANREFKLEIRKAKTQSWQELILTLDDDPWGLPYKIVLNRLRRSAPGLSITLESCDRAHQRRDADAWGHRG